MACCPFSRLLTLLLLGPGSWLCHHALADDACPPQRLVAPPSAVTEGLFGGAVAFVDGAWFIGDVRASTPSGSSVGKVHIYELVDGQLVWTQTLESPNPLVANNFGSSVTAMDDTVVVGATGMGWPGRTDRPGGLFVYERGAEAWELAASIEPPLDSDDVGRWAAATEGRIATRDTWAPPLFRVLLYERSADGWELGQIIDMPDGLDVDDGFGVGLAMDGQWLAISAYRDGSRVLVGGSVRLYRLGSDGLYEPVQTIMGEEGEQLGYAMAIDGRDMFVSAHSADRQESGQGVVYHYRLAGDRWTLAGEVAASPPMRLARLGLVLSLNQDTLMVGATKDVSGGQRTGIAYAFRPDPSGRWRQIARLVPQSPFRVEAFGGAVATDGSHALVGAPLERDASGIRTGAAYGYDLACGLCPADFDLDGALTIFDFLAFFNAFDAGDPIADFDGDGDLTLLDFLAFQGAFDGGCG